MLASCRRLRFGITSSWLLRCRWLLVTLLTSANLWWCLYYVSGCGLASFGSSGSPYLLWALANPPSLGWNDLSGVPVGTVWMAYLRRPQVVKRGGAVRLAKLSPLLVIFLRLCVTSAHTDAPTCGQRGSLAVCPP